MHVKLKKLFHDRCARITITFYALIVIFRLVETAMIVQKYGFDNRIVGAEFLGLYQDIIGSGIFIIGFWVLSLLLSKISNGLQRIVIIALLLLLSLIFFLIINFFIYHLIPLDIFLYHYSYQEIFFTLNTSSINYLQTAIIIVALLIVVFIVIRLINDVRMGSFAIKALYVFVFISLPLSFINQSLIKGQSNKYVLNKPVLFIARSIEYILNTDKEISPRTKDFRRLYPDKEFMSSEYPLLHKSNRENLLGKYFNVFDEKPNIVLLIVEGLNDDFIHKYRGISLMPFLSQLKDNSLYWNRCFTLGERSFAAIPSILGGLPYGDNGFTAEKRIPRHLSLVSILNSNDYYTSFFYGQGSWFHNKHRFFKYNDIDLIFDNANFSNDYEKIVVGDNNFFWGYNDKDLFNQSLRVLNSSKQNPRLTIYFTGTIHPPYIINDEAQYQKRLLSLADASNKKHFQTYSEYLNTVLFNDDALKEFFREYKKRQDFDNTIFFITGDHPNTDIPIRNSLKRYHVPLIVYSTKLKASQIFKNTVSHLDISETILSFLNDYLMNIPEISTSLGNSLFDNNKMENSKSIAFMNTNREVVDFLSGEYYLAADRLFKIDSALNIEEIENEFIKSLLIKRLDAFNSTCLYVTRKNQIISDKDYCTALQFDNIHSFKKPDTIEASSEYHELHHLIELKNSDFVLDLSLNLPHRKNRDFSIVSEILNVNDSVLYWKSFGVSEDRFTQIHFQFKKLNVKDSVLKFRTYLWNHAQTAFTISDVNGLLYKTKPHSENKKVN